MIPTHKGILLNLPEVDTEFKICQTCPISNGPALLSLGRLCDNKCLAVCDHQKCIIYKDKPILRANRCSTTGMHVTDLYNPKLLPPRIKQAYTNMQQGKSLKNMIELVHANLQ